MDNSITVENLKCTIKDRLILNDVSFDIKNGSFVSIVGPSGSGKSTLVKILLGYVKYEGTVNVCKMNVCKNNIAKIRKMVGFVSENLNNYLVVDTVEDELTFTLENLNKDPEEIKRIIAPIAKYLKIENILKKNVNELSAGERQLVALASTLILEPKVLILDESFSMLDGVSHKLLLEIINKIHEEKKLTVIFVTHDMNDTIYSDKIIVLNSGEIVLNDDKRNVYMEEKVLKKIGLNLPFMVDLSKRLGYYGLIDDIILNKDTMVKEIWK